jgi:hypothetical protein
MYPPPGTYKEYTGIGADVWMLGLSFIEVASIAAAVELIVGIMKCFAPAMRINMAPERNPSHPLILRSYDSCRSTSRPRPHTLPGEAQRPSQPRSSRAAANAPSL